MLTTSISKGIDSLKIFSAASLLTVLGIIYLLNNGSPEQIKSINTLASVRGMPDLSLNYADDVDINIKLAKQTENIKTAVPLNQVGFGPNFFRNLNDFENVPSHRVVDIVNQVPLALSITNKNQNQELVIEQIILEITNYKKLLPDLFKVINVNTTDARRSYFPIELNMDPSKKNQFLFQSKSQASAKVPIAPGESEIFFVVLSGKQVGRYDFMFRTYFDMNGNKGEKITDGKFRLIQLDQNKNQWAARREQKDGISMPLALLTQLFEPQEKPHPKKTIQTKSPLLYSVQMGAFTKKSNALNRYTRLKNKGYPTFLYSSKRRQQKLYQVRVGRFHTKEQAQRYANKLKKKEKLDFYIVKAGKDEKAPILMAGIRP